MAHYIDKDAIVEEIKHHLLFTSEHTNAFIEGEEYAYRTILSFLDTLEVKEVDIKDEVIKFMSSDEYQLGAESGCILVAKHFFELGLKASNSITEVNLESLVRQVIGLYLEAGKHYNSVIEEERKEYGGSDLAIKLFDGVIDARELGIQYVTDKLKAQKGE